MLPTSSPIYSGAPTPHLHLHCKGRSCHRLAKTPTVQPKCPKPTCRGSLDPSVAFTFCCRASALKITRSKISVSSCFTGSVQPCTANQPCSASPTPRRTRSNALSHLSRTSPTHQHAARYNTMSQTSIQAAVRIHTIPQPHHHLSTLNNYLPHITKSKRFVQPSTCCCSDTSCSTLTSLRLRSALMGGSNFRTRSDHT
jgi:hypothetical protein